MMINRKRITIFLVFFVLVIGFLTLVLNNNETYAKDKDFNKLPKGVKDVLYDNFPSIIKGPASNLNSKAPKVVNNNITVSNFYPLYHFNEDAFENKDDISRFDEAISDEPEDRWLFVLNYDDTPYCWFVISEYDGEYILEMYSYTENINTDTSMLEGSIRLVSTGNMGYCFVDEMGNALKLINSVDTEGDIRASRSLESNIISSEEMLEIFFPEEDVAGN
ncbi:MAG: hypothetical protein LBU94_02460 [Clostridiales bacterium]|nr:hypothetical protein [Clostridiales bacterium]